MEINPIKTNITANQSAQQTQQVQQAREAQVPQQEKPVEQASKGEFYQEPDQYSSKEPEPSPGLYWQEAGEDGPRVNFAPPEKEEGRPANVTTTNTDEVDREIERARKKVEDLESQLNQAPEGLQRERLEKQLKQAESDLQRKDNDSYRRQHAKIS